MAPSSTLNTEYYTLYLDDPAMPAFCSGSKMYVGAQPELLRVAENLQAQGVYLDTASGIRSYFEGLINATHHIACEELAVLEPVDVLDTSELVLQERKWDHINTWGFPYHMKFHKAKVVQLLVRNRHKYHRCLRASIDGFCYEGINGVWRPIGGCIFGQSSVLDIELKPDGFYSFASILYVIEDSSESAGELEARMNDSNAVIFDGLCDEVFGDG